MSWISAELAAVHAGNCATFVRDVLARHYGLTLRLAQFDEFLDDLENAQVAHVVKKIQFDAAVPTVDPQPGDVVLMEKTGGRLHLGVFVNEHAPAVLHVANRDGKAHCTKTFNLARMGYAINGFYRVAR